MQRPPACYGWVALQGLASQHRYCCRVQTIQSVKMYLSSLHVAELGEHVLHFADGMLRPKGTNQLRVQHLSS